MKHYLYIAIVIACFAAVAPSHAQNIFVDRQSNKDKNDILPDGELIPNEEIIKENSNKKEDSSITIIEDSDGVIELDGNVRILTNDDDVIYMPNKKN